MEKRRIAALLCAGLLGLSPALVACDKEDRKDIEEGVNDVEEQVDENVDTDGKDD